MLLNLTISYSDDAAPEMATNPEEFPSQLIVKTLAYPNGVPEMKLVNRFRRVVSWILQRVARPLVKAIHAGDSLLTEAQYLEVFHATFPLFYLNEVRYYEGEVSE